MAALEPRLEVDVSIRSDGTIPFDPDDSAGNDSSPQNGIVRVNDTVTFDVQYSVNDAPGTNATFRVTLPKGMEMTELPGYCTGPGSGITPETAGDPALPLTADSFDELVQQTFVCNLGNKEAASETVAFSAKVINLARQGQLLTVSDSSFAADETITPAVDDTLPSVTASARLKWDISKNGIALTQDTGYSYGPIDGPCPWDSALVCKANTFPLLISAPSGGKGAMPAIGDITLTDDVSAAALFPGLDPAQHAAIDADPEKYGSLIIADATRWMQPAAKIGESIEGTPATAETAVRNSGSIIVDQPARGAPASITISGSDMTLRTYPSKVARPANTSLPSDAAYAISLHLRLYTPVATIRNFGLESSNRWVLPIRNEFSDLEINGFTAADKQDSESQPTWNDYRTKQLVIELAGGFSKQFLGLPGAPGNMPPAQFNPSDSSMGEGPPGGSTMKSGTITVAPTQTVVSGLLVVGSSPSMPAPISWVGCDSWDNTKLHLRKGTFGPSLSALQQRVPSNGDAVWVSGYNNLAGNGNSGRWATSKADTPPLTVEYSATPGGSDTTAQCDDAKGPWYADPAAVPGNDPGLAAEGIYSGVGRVRVHMIVPAALNVGTTTAGVRTMIDIALYVADIGDSTGTILPNWASEKRVLNAELDLAETVADGSRPWADNTYNPTTHGGTQGDRLILATAQSRINKLVRKGTDGPFSNTPPQTTGGDVVQYELTPSLTSGAEAPEILRDVWVEDCLPSSQAYASATVTPAVVLIGETPSDAKRNPCASTDTYIRWVFEGHEVNTPLPVIVLTVEVSPTAADGAYNNTVVVWAEGDATPAGLRTSEAQIQVANIAGVKLEKRALTPVVQVNRAGQATNQLNRWAVTLSNMLPPEERIDLEDPDIIDVLPQQGLGATDFEGSFAFVEATVTGGGPGVRILYTRAASVDQDPTAPSNGASGSTAWCDAPSAGSIVSGVGACPTSPSEVTGLRVQQPGPYDSGDTISFEVAMVGVNNAAGDAYQNVAFAAVSGLSYPVGPIRRTEVVIGSSIGDYTWWDLDYDGLQGEAENPARGVKVSLSGTDDLGNAVSAQTTTDRDGKYIFEALRSSDAAGYTVKFEKPSGASGFTLANAASPEATEAVDSDPDPATGSVVRRLGPATRITTLDAGFVAVGSLEVIKVLKGAGVDPLAYGTSLTFEVECSYDGELVHESSISLTIPAGSTSVASDPIEKLPVGAICEVSETSAPGADPQALPSVTVTIPWDNSAQASPRVSASLTNYYSAGVVQITKTLEGDADAVAEAEKKTFEFLLTCQLETSEGRVTVHSGPVQVTGSQTVRAKDSTGGDLKLPLDTHCFADETDDGGADGVWLSHVSFDDAAVVSPSSSTELAQLEITAVNTFYDVPSPGGDDGDLGSDGAARHPDAAGLAPTGGVHPGLILLGIALLVGGTVMIARSRQNRS